MFVCTNENICQQGSCIKEMARIYGEGGGGCMGVDWILATLPFGLADNESENTAISQVIH